MVVGFRETRPLAQQTGYFARKRNFETFILHENSRLPHRNPVKNLDCRQSIGVGLWDCGSIPARFPKYRNFPRNHTVTSDEYFGGEGILKSGTRRT